MPPERRPWATLSLIAVCLAVFALGTAAGGTESTLVLIRYGALSRPLVLAGEVWRLSGAMFLHIGITHLVVNMASLWALGPVLEKVYGPLRFLFMYAVSGLAGSAASLAFQRPGVVSAGASGAIFGLVGVVGYLTFRIRDRRALTQVALVVLANLVVGWGIHADNWAHLGGLAGGLLVALWLRPTTRVSALLLLVALLPFLAEIGVVVRGLDWTGVTSLPRVTYTDPQGRYRLAYPALMTVRPQPDGQLQLSGPGFNVFVVAQAFPGYLSVRRDADLLERMMVPPDMEVGSRELLEDTNHRSWLRLRLPLSHTEMLITAQGHTAYLLGSHWISDLSDAQGQALLTELAAHFELLVKPSEQSAQAHFETAVNLMSQSKFEPAGRAFSQAIEADPAHAESYLSRGYLELNQGQLEKACADFDKAAQLDPKNPRAYFHRGLVEMDRDQFGAAEADFSRALELEPDASGSFRAELLNNRAWCRIKRKEYPGALRDTQDAVKNAGEDKALLALVYDTQALAEEGLGHTEQALTDYGLALKNNPRLAESYANRALLLARLGRQAEARRDRDAFFKLASPEHPRAGELNRVLPGKP